MLPAISEYDVAPPAGSPAPPASLAPTLMQMLTEFHQAFGQTVGTDPTEPPSVADVRLRTRLMAEETGEYLFAEGTGDVLEIAQELSDIVYIAFGTAVTYGIDLLAVVAEVHRANMSKLDGNGLALYDANGKVLKGPNYEKPNIARALGIPWTEELF